MVRSKSHWRRIYSPWILESCLGQPFRWVAAGKVLTKLKCTAQKQFKSKKNSLEVDSVLSSPVATENFNYICTCRTSIEFCFWITLTIVLLNPKSWINKSCNFSGYRKWQWRILDLQNWPNISKGLHRTVSANKSRETIFKMWQYQ